MARYRITDPRTRLALGWVRAATRGRALDLARHDIRAGVVHRAPDRIKVSEVRPDAGQELVIWY